MRILLIDETAGSAERFSSTDSKFANIGSGTSTDRLSVSVTVFMTTGPSMTNGRCRPTSVAPSSGSTSSISPNDTFGISTGLSRIPLATCDGDVRAQSLDYDSVNGFCTPNGKILPHFQIIDLTTGG